MCAGEWEWELVWVGRVLVVIWLLGCGIARHIKCPSDRVKTSLHEGHDAQPVEEIVGEMGVHDVQPGQGGRCVQGNGS